MAYLTLGEAAKEAGIAKSTLSKALKSGKISYAEKSAAGYRIDAAELFRVFPRKHLETPRGERLETPPETPEITLLRARLDAAERRAAELTEERNAWRDQAQRLALTHQPSTPTEGAPRPGFFGRIFGR